MRRDKVHWLQRTVRWFYLWNTAALHPSLVMISCRYARWRMWDYYCSHLAAGLVDAAGGSCSRCCCCSQSEVCNVLKVKTEPPPCSRCVVLISDYLPGWLFRSPWTKYNYYCAQKVRYGKDGGAGGCSWMNLRSISRFFIINPKVHVRFSRPTIIFLISSSTTRPYAQIPVNTPRGY